MDLIRELIGIIEEAASVPKTAAAAVYHRDYVKTKNKKYRKYSKKKAAPKVSGDD